MRLLPERNCLGFHRIEEGLHLCPLRAGQPERLGELDDMDRARIAVGFSRERQTHAQRAGRRSVARKAP
jgi:hypothetical protein